MVVNAWFVSGFLMVNSCEMMVDGSCWMGGYWMFNSWELLTYRGELMGIGSELLVDK